MKARASVWSSKGGTVTLHLSGAELFANIELTPEAAATLAKDLTKAINELPRVASAADLGLEAA